IQAFVRGEKRQQFPNLNIQYTSGGELPQFKLDVLVEGCKDCCQADQNETGTVKYSSAVLEVCK
ncbi:hypothetical protein, partial [Salmonella sp. s54925]|uniref:hypothetical protein n=1 Tax=Salmonella sp. s54925 TaxID=3159674 RepID=UPI00397FB82C